jgi:hypothetical protein
MVSNVGDRECCGLYQYKQVTFKYLGYILLFYKLRFREVKLSHYRPGQGLRAQGG